MERDPRKRMRDILNQARKATGRGPLPEPPKKKKRKLSGAAKQAVEEKKARIKAKNAPSPASDVRTKRGKLVRQLQGEARRLRLQGVQTGVAKHLQGKKISYTPPPSKELVPVDPKPKTGTSLVPQGNRALAVVSNVAKKVPNPWVKALAWFAGTSAATVVADKVIDSVSNNNKPRQMTRKNQRGQPVVVQRGIPGMPDDPTWEGVKNEEGKAAVAPKQLRPNGGRKRPISFANASAAGHHDPYTKADNIPSYKPSGPMERDNSKSLRAYRDWAGKPKKPDAFSQGLSNLLGVKVTPGHQVFSPEEGGFVMRTSPHAKYNPAIDKYKAIREQKKRKKKGWSNTAFPQK